MLSCADATLYTGVAKDLPRRVNLHNQGKGAKYTKNRTPVKLVYKERAEDKSSALKREHQIKQMSRQAKIELIHYNRVWNHLET
jgi:putative endonuclease